MPQTHPSAKGVPGASKSDRGAAVLGPLFYRKFIHEFAAIAQPLYALTCKGATFSWSKECSAFDELKSRFTNSPVLRYTNFDRPFVLETDASYQELESILS